MKRAKEILALLAAVLVAAIGWLAAFLEDVFHWLHLFCDGSMRWLIMHHGPLAARKRYLKFMTGSDGPGLTD